MKYALLSCLWMLAVFATALPVRAAENTVTIDTPYAFAAPSGARSAAAFMTLTYPAATGMEGDLVPDRLMAVQTPVAGRAEVHAVLIEDNTMMMRKVDVLPLPPGGKLMLSPQGSHIMMMELRQPLRAGDSFPMTLVFEKAGPIEIAVPVRAPGDMPKVASEMTGEMTREMRPAPKVELVSEPPEEKAVHDELEQTLEQEHHH